MPDQPRLLLLASARTYRNRAFTDAARRLGLEVVLGLDLPPPMLRHDSRRLAIDYRDLGLAAEAIERYAETNPLAAILGVDDSGTVLAARASARLGLPHNAPEAVEAAADKHVMRRKFADAGVPSPNFHAFNINDDPEDVATIIGEAGAVGYPCVLKPTRLSASKGVMRADDPLQLIERWLRLRGLLAKEGCDDVLVEAFIPGVEVALEGLLDGGQLRVLALFDKPDPLDGPFFEETIYVTPSRLPPAIQQAVARAAADASTALGLRTGPVHAELRLVQAKDGALQSLAVIEVAARSIGGLCSQTLRFVQAGASLEELILRQQLGMELESAEREARAGGVMMIPIPGAGLLRKVSGLDEAQRVPLIEAVEITAPPNYPLIPLPEGDAYLGFIFARGDTPEAVEAALRQAHACLQFEIEPELKLAAKAAR